LEEKLANIQGQQENHQYILGMKKIMQYLLMQEFGLDQGIINREMKHYLKHQKEKQKMLEQMWVFVM
jgi:hypothetical protein